MKLESELKAGVNRLEEALVRVEKFSRRLVSETNGDIREVIFELFNLGRRN